MQARDQLANLARVEAGIRGTEVDPVHDPRAGVAEVGDQPAIDRAADDRDGYARRQRRLLEGRALRDRSPLAAAQCTDLLDRPAPGIRVEAPDRADPATRHRCVRQAAVVAERECRDERRDVALREQRGTSAGR